MIAQYKSNTQDQGILDDITGRLAASLPEWYGQGSTLDARRPEIRSYRNCFMLRYPITTAEGQKKHILVKIRRKPKMESLTEAVGDDIHKNIPIEYRSLNYVYDRLGNMDDNFGAIRPLTYLNQYFAIVMEEYPSRSLRQLLNDHRAAKTEKSLSELKDAARKTGRWLYHFHQHIHIPNVRPYTIADILFEVHDYAVRLESCSNGRVLARSIEEAFAKKIEHIHVDQVKFSQSHADMTCDNVLYSDDQKVCIIDIKTRLAPIYADLGLVLIHPETAKPQIFSGGRYYSESILRVYRDEIVAGYFEHEAGQDVLVKIYSTIKVLDKWLMYEDLMCKYKGVKHMLSIPTGPFVSAYFMNLFKKHLSLIPDVENRQAMKIEGTTARSSP